MNTSFLEPDCLCPLVSSPFSEMIDRRLGKPFEAFEKTWNEWPVKNNKSNQQVWYIVWQLFLSVTLATIWLILSHDMEKAALTQCSTITGLCLIWPKRHQVPHKEVRYQSLAECTYRLQSCNFLIWVNKISQSTSHSPLLLSSHLDNANKISFLKLTKYYWGKKSLKK